MLYPQQNEIRKYFSLDGFWDFYADKTGEGSYEEGNLPSTRPLAVPASWNEQYEDLFQFHGKGWYRKNFFLPADWEGQDVYLRIGSVSGCCRAWVNGALIAEHVGNSLPVEGNMTAAARFGEENTLVVLADSTLDPWSLPPATLMENEGRMGFANSYPAVPYDFFPYGGIQRSVTLYTAPAVRIEDVIIKTRMDGRVSFTVRLSSGFEGDLCVSADGVSFCKTLTGEKEIQGELTIPDPKLWDIGKPNLYNLHVVLQKGEKVWDAYRQRFGVREVTVVGDQLHLNGRRVFLRGFGKHEDFHVLGKGFHPAVVVKDFGLLRWIGANSFRTSHYPYDEKILDMADEQGFLVIAETPFVSLNARNYTEPILEKAKSVIQEMIERDKNHPSVILWSLANEPIVDTDEGEEFFRQMAETARALDDSRPITYVAFIEPRKNRGMKYYDIVCLNRYYGWYEYPGQAEEALGEFVKSVQRFYDAYGKGILMGEFGADAIEGMHTNPPMMFSEEYQSRMIEIQYEALRKLPYMVGAHVWSFADFMACQTCSRVIYNRKGVFTRERNPKMAAHTIKRLWEKEAKGEGLQP